jgi:putative ABC transport system permease protein
MRNPPQLFLRFFRWFCHPELRDHIEGDLMELYDGYLRQFGEKVADRKFVIDVLLLFRPGIVRTSYGYHHLNN